MIKHPTPRKPLETALNVALALLVGDRLHAAEIDIHVRGPFSSLSTPFTETGAVDYEGSRIELSS